MAQNPDKNTLFYGDNLGILREHVADESVDLVYLDPPFNSNANYNILFKTPDGAQSQSQIEAFEDTWQWNLAAERAYDEVLKSGNSDAANMLAAMRSFLGTNDMMAYLAMMAVRLIELHRVLKPTGSLYLHCDPTASHYLKLLLDAVFGADRLLNEIVWQRSTGKALMTRRLPSNHDILLSYSMGEAWVWNQYDLYKRYDPSNLPAKTAAKYSHSDEDGRVYRLDSLINPNSNRPNLTYEFLGVTRVWRWTRERMERAYEDGIVVQTAPGRVPQMKRYLDEQEGIPISDVWTDIAPLNSQAQERLGYPTQKPLALLERILAASSNEGDVVLDPFCGCGTTVHAAQKMGRKWIGIDVTHLAVGLIKRRLTDAFPMADFQVLGTPQDVAAAQALADTDKHQFQLWALSMLDNAVPYKGGKKGADGGVDGYVFFQVPSSGGAGSKTETGKAIVSIKGGGVQDSHVKDLITTVEHEKAQMGLFVTLKPPTKPMITRAASAGFYEAGGKSYPKVQILTIEQLFDGKRPEMPWLDPSVFKKAKKEIANSGQGTLL
jgi:site-specific DNA-methyltransferase (adenine-specific)